MAEYINKEDVFKKVISSISVPSDNEWDCGYNTAMTEMKEFIKQLPVVDVQLGSTGNKNDTIEKLYECDKIRKKIESLEDKIENCKEIAVTKEYIDLRRIYAAKLKKLWNEVNNELKQLGVTYDERDLIFRRFYIGLTWKECERLLGWNADKIIEICTKFGIDYDNNEI